MIWTAKFIVMSKQIIKWSYTWLGRKWFFKLVLVAPRNESEVTWILHCLSSPLQLHRHLRVSLHFWSLSFPTIVSFLFKPFQENILIIVERNFTGSTWNNKEKACHGLDTWWWVPFWFKQKWSLRAQLFNDRRYRTCCYKLPTGCFW